MQPKRRMKEAKQGLKTMGAKKTGIRGKKQKKNRCKPEQEPLEKDDEEGHCNIHVAIKEQQEKNTVDSNRKRKKDRLTKEKVKSN